MFANIDWQAIAAQTVILTFAFGLIAWLVRPRCKTWIWDVIAEEPDKLRTLLKKELAAIASLADTVSEHTDTLAFIKSSVTQQGQELRMLPEVARTIEQMGESFKTMTQTLTDIHKEVIEHGKKFERWDGFREGQEWPGTERRGGGGRRKGDSK